MPEFFQTNMGRKFFEADVPRAIKALENIAERLATQQKYDEYERALRFIAAQDSTWAPFVRDVIKETADNKVDN